jgi:predicted transposase YbfD/YdcC
MDYAEQTNAGHGRIEKRRLWMLPVYDDFVAWPGARLMLRLERTMIHKSSRERSVERHYALASLDADEITASQLLSLWRQHWQIENGLHYVRDVTLGEDTSRVRKHHAPQTFAAIRNLVIATAHRAGFTNIAQAVRTFAQKPYCALAQFILL